MSLYSIIFLGVLVGGSAGLVCGLVVFLREQKGMPMRALCAALFAALAAGFCGFLLSGESLKCGLYWLIMGIPVFFLAKDYFVPWYLSSGQGNFPWTMEWRDEKEQYAIAGVCWGVFGGYFIAQWGALNLGGDGAIAMAIVGCVIGAVPALGAWYFLKLSLGLFFIGVGRFGNRLIRLATALS